MRIATNELHPLPNVAFRTPDERKVLIVLNDGRSAQTFSIRDGDKPVTSTLSAGAVEPTSGRDGAGGKCPAGRNAGFVSRLPVSSKRARQIRNTPWRRT